MKTLLFLLSFLLETNIVYSQLAPVLIEPCNDPRFVFRVINKNSPPYSVFIKTGDVIHYSTSYDFKSTVYLENKGQIKVDSLYVEYKKILFESKQLEFKNYLSGQVFYKVVNVNKDSLQYFNEMKNTKGMAYLINQYLEPDSFTFQKVDLVFIYFLFLNCIPIEENEEKGEYYLSYDIQEWHPELFLELLKTRRPPTKYEEYKEFLKKNPYE